MDAWFWRQTVAGSLLISLRDVALASENDALKLSGLGSLCRRPGWCSRVSLRTPTVRFGMGHGRSMFLTAPRNVLTRRCCR